MAKCSFQSMSKKKKIFLIVLISILVILLGLLIASVIVYNSFLNKLNRFEPATEPSVPNETKVIVEDESVSTEPTVDPYDFEVMFPGEEPIGGEIINIMLVGQDTRDPEYRGLSDTMILISINPETKKLVMTSFLRDLYIDIVGIGGSGLYKDRLNTAYCTGGISQLGDTLAYNFGVEIDNYVEVDFYAFETLVDAMDGVDIILTDKEVEHMYYYSGKNWDLKEGINHLNGQQALVYARIRSIDNDFNRTERQRNVINALFEKVKEISIFDMLKLGEQFFPLVTTDMSNKDITKYIIQLAPVLMDLEVESLRIPADNTWGGTNVGTEEAPKYVIQCMDTKTNRDMLKRAMGILEETEATEATE